MYSLYLCTTLLLQAVASQRKVLLVQDMKTESFITKENGME